MGSQCDADDIKELASIFSWGIIILNLMGKFIDGRWARLLGRNLHQRL